MARTLDEYFVAFVKALFLGTSCGILLMVITLLARDYLHLSDTEHGFEIAGLLAMAIVVLTFKKLTADRK